MRSLGLGAALIIALWSCDTAAQDIAAQETAHRAAVLAHLPPDAAQRLFGGEVTPVAGSPEAIGAYERGCLEGAVALPADGPNWQVMRPSRNRAWGHPALIALLERVAQQLPAAAGWPGLLVGADGNEVDEAWTLQHRLLLEVFAREPTVARIFVNPAIKQELCHEAGADRAWLTKIRPWWGHNEHFHIRLSCPTGQSECRSQAPPPAGDGCGKELSWWFTPEARHPPRGAAKPLLVADLPRACARLVAVP